MTNLANLALKIDSTEVKTGVSELDKLTEAGKRTEKAAGSMASAHVRAGQQIVQSAGAQRAGMQQLSYQLGDVATMYAMGAKPMQIFASQSGQVLQAVQLMTGGTSKLAAFLGGPWGIAVMAGVTVLGTLIPKLLETKTAMDDVTLASSGLGNAQSVLGEMFDMSTGKIKSQNDMLRMNAQLMAMNLRNEAMTQRASAKDAAESAGEWNWKAIILNRRGNQTGNIYGSYDNPHKKLLEAVLAGKVSGSKAQSLAANLDFSEVNIDKMKYMQALVDATSASLKEQTAAAVDASLANNKLADSFIKPTKAVKEHVKAIKELKDNPLDKMVDDMMANMSKLMLDGPIADQEYFNDLARQYGTFLERDTKLMEGQEAVRRGQVAAEERLLDIYLQQLGVIGQMGGAFGTIAGILGGLATGNFSGVGGQFGGMLGIISSIRTGNTISKDGKDVAETLGDKLSTIFDKNGTFYSTMISVFQNAAVGSSMSKMVLGQNGSSLGGAIGGVLGGKLGEKFLSKGFESIAKGLGSFAGPLGSIVGGVLGGVVGGLFKKAKWGATVVTNTTDKPTAIGNNAGAMQAVTGVAVGLQSALNKIVDALGGTSGTFKVSIGKYKDNYRVSASGYANPGEKHWPDNNPDAIYAGDDPNEAMRIAVLNAIEDGAVQGIRDGAKKLLLAGIDLDAALNKALQFQGVFDELSKRLDPVQYELDALTKQFDGLRNVFNEAGATAEEYTQLEQLLALKRQDILDKQASDALDKLNDRRSLEVRLLEAQGKASEASALQRAIELSQTKDELKPLMAQVQAAEAAAEALDTVTQKFSAFASELKAFRDDLLGISGSGMSYSQAMVKLMTTGGLAAAGDQTALGALTGVGKDFLALSKDNASSAVQYQRDVAMVRNYLDQAIAVTDNPSAYVTAPAAVNVTPDLTTGTTVTQAVVETNTALLGQIDALKAEIINLKTAMEAIKEDTGKSRRLHERWDRGGSLAVSTDADTPLNTVTA